MLQVLLVQPLDFLLDAKEDERLATVMVDPDAQVDLPEFVVLLGGFGEGISTFEHQAVDEKLDFKTWSTNMNDLILTLILGNASQLL